MSAVSTTKTTGNPGPLFDLPEASRSEIVLNCRSGQEIAITPTFYTLDGTVNLS
jgi:hypothetical protein